MKMLHFLAQPKRITTNLKTKNNHNCQKIKLYGNPTTKELKKHSSRLVEEKETGGQGSEDTTKQWVVDRGREGSDWWTGIFHICMGTNKKEELERETDHAMQGSSTGK